MCGASWKTLSRMFATVALDNMYCTLAYICVAKIENTLNTLLNYMPLFTILVL